LVHSFGIFWHIFHQADTFHQGAVNYNPPVPVLPAC
jgi:hypothetical protein